MNEVSVDLHEAAVVEAVHRENSITREMVVADKSFIANHIVTNVCSFPLRLYCPFCCSDCMSESKLKGHLRNEHASYLEMISADNNTNSLHSCQFCPARFYTDDLVMKHILKHHQDKVIIMFQEGEENKYITCGFCPYMVIVENKQRLLAHVQETHFSEFRTFIKQKFTQISQCEKLQYTLDMKNSSTPNLNILFMQMSTKENKDTKTASVEQSECSSSFQFVNQNQSQLSDEDGNFLHNRKISGIKSEIPVRKKLRFDLPKDQEFKKFNEENIISCSKDMKLVTKYIPNPFKIKSVSTWKSLFSSKRKKTYRNKSISKLVTSTPKTLNDLQIDIRKTKCIKHILVNKRKEEAEAMLVTPTKEGISEKYSVSNTDDDDDDDDDDLQMHNTNVNIVISKTPHTTISEIKKGFIL
jgi:hypothetical protein